MRNISHLQAFDLFFPQDIWGTMVIAVNRNLARGRNCDVKRDSRYKDTTISEIKKFYAIQMALENSWGNSNRNLRNHIGTLKQKYSNWPRGFGVDRIRALRGAMILSIDELQDISNRLHKKFVDNIEPTTVCDFICWVFRILTKGKQGNNRCSR